MIVIKEDSNQYAIKLKQRVDYEYDFDEDSMSYDIDSAIEQFNEEASEIVNNREFLDDYFSEKSSSIKGIDFNIGETFAEAIVFLNESMSKSDVEFYFDSFMQDVIAELSSVTVTIEGDFDYDDFDPSTEYGYVSRSKHGESEGEISIKADGKVQIEYNK